MRLSSSVVRPVQSTLSDCTVRPRTVLATLGVEPMSPVRARTACEEAMVGAGWMEVPVAPGTRSGGGGPLAVWRGRTLDEAAERRMASGVVLLLVVALVASLNSVWLSVRLGDGTSRYDGLELPVLRYALVGVAVVAVVGTLIEGPILARWPLTTPALAGAVVFVLATTMLLLEEMAASQIPTRLLPTSVRRLAVDVYGGVGIWVAVVAGLALVGLSRVDGGPIALARTAKAAAALLPWRLLAVLTLAGALVATSAWLRYQPWASGSAGPEHVEVSGWSLPFIGPASLVAVLAMGAAAAALIVRRHLAGALVLAVSGWATSFLAAITLVTASTLARVEVDHLLPETVAEYGPSVGPRWGAWGMFAAGCAAAACGVAIVGWLERAER